MSVGFLTCYSNIICCMWLFKHKFDFASNLQHHKARLVVNDKSQQIRLDCDDTFSPVVKLATICIVLSLALSHSWAIHQLDVKKTFVHSNSEETVYVPTSIICGPLHPFPCVTYSEVVIWPSQTPRAWYHRFATYIH